MNQLAALMKNKKSKSKNTTNQKEGRKEQNKNQSSSNVRLINDWDNWVDIPGVTLEFADPAKIDNCTVTIKPKSGYWENASIKFELEIPETYPFDAPKVKCLSTPIYHPNINFHGNVCLNILREGWRPVMSITEVVYGLILLLDSPNPYDPLPNKTIAKEFEAHELLLKDESSFAILVKKTLDGGNVEELGKYFNKLYV